MIQPEVRELAGVFRGELRRVFNPYPAFIPDLTWPSAGLLDALFGGMYGRREWSGEERLFVEGAAAHLAELVYECWRRFARRVQVHLDEESGVVCAAERDDGSTYRLDLQAVLARAVREARARDPDAQRTGLGANGYPVERLALSACLGIDPSERGGKRETGPGGPLDSIDRVVRFLAETCAESYADRFPSEPLGAEPELYLHDLIRPPVAEASSILAAGAGLLGYLDERADDLARAFRLLGNLARFPAAGVREAAYICLLLDERIALPAELLEIVSDGVVDRAAVHRAATIRLAARRGRAIDWLEDGENAAERFDFERRVGLLPLIRLPFDICTDRRNRSFVEALVRQDAQLASRIIDRRLPGQVSAELIRQQAVLRRQLGDPEGAEDLFVRLARHHPNRLDGEYYLEAGCCALDLGRPDEAVERLEEAQVLLVWDPRLVEALAQAYAEVGRREDAMSLLDRAVSRGEGIANVLLLRADVHSALGSEEGYYSDLSTAAALHPFHPRVAEKVMASYLAF